jgi:hypothetical protein
MIVSLFETKTVRHFGRSACGNLIEFQRMRSG